MSQKANAVPGSQVVTLPQITISNSGVPSASTRAELSVSHLPEIKVDAPTDWLAIVGLVASILAFVVTAYIVKKTTEQQIASMKASIDAQKKFAEDSDRQIRERVKAEILSKNRQDWINSLRDTMAQYVAVLLKISDLHSLKVGTDPANNTLSPEIAINNNLEWCRRLNEEKSNLVSLKCKIHLLANPTEPEFKILLNRLDVMHEMAMDEKMGLHIHTPELIQLTQIILKNEWERVKGLEGFVSSQCDADSLKIYETIK
ncbi:hypothetical protein [Undibacterium sp. Di24W]|uniref:hypothetical protein n=1 Tax=Undibacterium sp. Di24W TaxID=3413033 RepID=UPI003BF0AE2C